MARTSPCEQLRTWHEQYPDPSAPPDQNAAARADEDEWFAHFAGLDALDRDQVTALAALEARAHAARGDGRETRSALGRAETGLAALDAGSLTASAFGYTEAQIRFHEGSAYTRLGETRVGATGAGTALAVCAPGDYTDWALIQLDRSACLLMTAIPAMQWRTRPRRWPGCAPSRARE